MPDQPSSQYFERLGALGSAVYSCIEVSHNCEGILSPTSRHFYASVLFTVLCTRGVSLATVAPYSKWAERLIEHWDFSSIAVLTRSILEIRIAFFYLCIEECSIEEWGCRWNLFNLHDCISRIRLFKLMETGTQDIIGFEAAAEELRVRLSSNSFFMNLTEKKRNRFIKGRYAYLHPLGDIAVRAGVKQQIFPWIYHLLSSHVHGLPMSFYRMGDSERGRGVHSEVEENYTSLCLSLCTSLLVKSRDEMKRLFEGVHNDKDCNVIPH
ncbi:MAG: DUF5677 domain-containing protein [Syntrophales bacterium]|jgi:hypothetical protein